MAIDPGGRPRTSEADRAAPPELAARLADWVDAGIITPDQAARIAAREEARPPAPKGPAIPGSLLSEALGYVGGVVVLVAAVLLATEFWEEFGTAGRLAVVGAAAAVMLAAGFAVPRRSGGPGRRLRAVLWAGATGAFAGFTALAASDLLGLSGDDVAVTTSIVTAAVAFALWRLGPTVLQQLVALLTAALAVATVTARLTDADHLPGASVWALGVLWFLLASRGGIKPRRVSVVLGAATAAAGALTTLPTDPGIALALVTSAALVAVAVATADVALLSVGAVALLVALPTAVQTWFGGTFAAPLALLVAGLTLVGAALWIARRRHDPGVVRRRRRGG